MPYIDEAARARLDPAIHGARFAPRTAGELNYAITKTIDGYLAIGGMAYIRINEAIGVLECAKLELYRRIAAPFEDQKRAENGDVYDSAPKT